MTLGCKDIEIRKSQVVGKSLIDLEEMEGGKNSRFGRGEGLDEERQEGLKEYEGLGKKLKDGRISSWDLLEGLEE